MDDVLVVLVKDRVISLCREFHKGKSGGGERSRYKQVVGEKV
jgi:hypothetical protein